MSFRVLSRNNFTFSIFPDPAFLFRKDKMKDNQPPIIPYIEKYYLFSVWLNLSKIC